MKKRITIASAKAKGRRLQQWVAERISKTVDAHYGKDEDIESRPMGQSGTDVILRGHAKTCFPYAVECKSQEKKSIPFAWIDQAKANIGDFKTWLLFCKRSNEKPIIIMDAEEFFRIYESYYNYTP